jgi:hypothetical protein
MKKMEFLTFSANPDALDSLGKGDASGRLPQLSAGELYDSADIELHAAKNLPTPGQCSQIVACHQLMLPAVIQRVIEMRRKVDEIGCRLWLRSHRRRRCLASRRGINRELRGSPVRENAAAQPSSGNQEQSQEGQRRFCSQVHRGGALRARRASGRSALAGGPWAPNSVEQMASGMVVWLRFSRLFSVQVQE